MCETSTVVGVVCLAVLATVVGSSLARSNETNATNAISAKSVSAVSNHAQVTPSVLAATAMMATAIGLAAALRHQASPDNADRNRKRIRGRIRPRKFHNGAGWPRHPKQPTRPSTNGQEDDKIRVLYDLVRDLYGHLRKSMTKQTMKSLEEKIQNGVDIEEWEEIDAVVREEIGNEDALKKWEQVDEIIQEKFENGEDIDWEEILRGASTERSKKKCAIL